MNKENKGVAKLARGLLNDGPVVLTVNTCVSRGNLAIPVGNYSVYAHKMPRF